MAAACYVVGATKAKLSMSTRGRPRVPTTTILTMCFALVAHHFVNPGRRNVQVSGTPLVRSTVAANAPST